MSRYAELQVTTHFSFLRGASSPSELFQQAKLLGIEALLSGVVGACSGPAVAPAGSPGAPAGPAAASADAAFGQFVDDYFEADSRYSPTEAVGNGFHAYDAQIAASPSAGEFTALEKEFGAAIDVRHHEPHATPAAVRSASICAPASATRATSRASSGG